MTEEKDNAKVVTIRMKPSLIRVLEKMKDAAIINSRSEFVTFCVKAELEKLGIKYFEEEKE